MNQVSINSDLSKQPRSNKANLWFWWIGLTLIYFVLFNITKSIPAFGMLAGLVGLFVPFGPSNWFFVNIFGFGAPLLIFIVIIWAFEKYSKDSNMNLGLKIFFNLVILLLYTLVLDLVFFKQWLSLYLLLHNFTFPPSMRSGIF